MYNQLLDLIIEIEKSSQLQFVEIDNIKRTVEKISKDIEQNFALSEELSGAAKSLHSNVNNLDKLIYTLKN